MELSNWDYVQLVCGIYFALKISFLILGIIGFIVKEHILSWFCKIDLISTYGPWAAITGATAGIGYGLAKGLAHRGMNIVLISRNPQKLKEAAKNIEMEYGVKTKIIISEATDRKSYEQILNQLVDMDIGILVNNVAILTAEQSISLKFHETRNERVYEMNTVNCGAGTILTRGLLPYMIKRKRGLVINMSSFAALHPVIYQAQYSSTKIYLDVLGDCIKEEIKDTGVKIKTVRPYIVQSQMTANNSLSYNSPMAQSPKQFMRSLIPSLASDTKSCGFWLSDLFAWTFTMWPKWIQQLQVTYIMKFAVSYGKVIPLSEVNK